MNILYLHTHDTGRCIGAYGYPSHTPEMDSFASQSVLFRNAHSTAPTCSPSRASLLTGSYPHEVGMLGLAHRGFRIDDYSLHLASHLKLSGYTTALCGVQHVAPRKNLIGYDRILDDKADYFDLDITDLPAYDAANAERVARFLESPPDSPFFLSFGMLDTHRPFFGPGSSPPASFPPSGVRPPAPVPDTPETRSDASAFHHSIRAADRCIGKVLDALSRSGAEEDTLVILTTDHGPAFPEMKAGLSDSGTGVMLIMRVPRLGEQASGRTVESMVSQLDILPTICDLAGIDTPRRLRDRYPLRGTSLRPLLEGEDKRGDIHSCIFTETTFHAAYEPSRAVRSARYKLIRRFSPHPHRLPVNVDDSAAKDLFNAGGYFDEPWGGDELYDLLLDPTEKRNRTGDPRYRGVEEELASTLVEWMRETGDPLPEGPVPTPEDAFLNDPESYSPEA